ncbi:hypothetical protein MKW92_022969 [Papaver armeniacum]|nr:hypothetical protein MKW92_022969 [Papaver armeniacum]
MAVEYHCCETGFFVYIGVIVLLVLFAGLMSGLTLGLMSMSVVDLEVLAKSGTPKDRQHAAKILPVVKKQHLLLCTLLICNAAAMEALPVFLDGLVTTWGAITLILLVGLIIPQSICSRYGLAIGATVPPFVRVLVFVCYLVAFPISKSHLQRTEFVFLSRSNDYLLGNRHVALLCRAELKTLVDMHGNEAGKGGELTHDETTIIAGALELTTKTAGDLMNLILEKGHSRLPVFYEQPTNIIGLILVKNLLTVHPNDEFPVKSVTIRKIPRVPETLPLYDILNEFQKGHSHMAVVIRRQDKHIKQAETELSAVDNTLREVRVDIDTEKKPQKKNLKSKSFKKLNSFQSNANTSSMETQKAKTKKWDTDVLDIDDNPLPTLADEEEAVGIISMEDVIEELLQEEIFDETDHQYEDL